MHYARIADECHAVAVDEQGRLVSLRSVPHEIELVQEPRLADSFRISLPLEGHLDHTLDGSGQDVAVTRTSDTSIEIKANRLVSSHGTFEIAATFTVALADGAVCFDYAIENATDLPLAEVWYPIVGGVTGVPDRKTTSWQAPGYVGLWSSTLGKGPDPRLGAQTPRVELVYPYGEMLGECRGLTMPWLTFHDESSGLSATFTEHSRLQRRISLTAEIVPGLHRSDSDDDWPTD